MKRLLLQNSATRGLAVLAGTLALATTVSARQTTLDSFDTVLFGVNTLGPATAGPTDITPDSEIPGIMRTVSITLTGGTGNSTSDNLLGSLVYDNGALAQSTLNFQYTFPSFDLAATGATHFGYFLSNTEPGKNTDYTITLTSPDGSATGTGTLPITAGFVNISLADLVLLGTPFNDLTQVTFELRPNIPGTDLVIDAYGFNEIPEPSTYAAIGFIGLAAGLAYRRRAKKA